MEPLNAVARDPDGKYAQTDPELHDWFSSLGSGRGKCCEFADGKQAEYLAEYVRGNLTIPKNLRRAYELNENGNDTVPLVPGDESGHYYVLLKNQKNETLWVQVPDNAIVTEPNKTGTAWVWPWFDFDGEPHIRCFMPGAGM